MPARVIQVIETEELCGKGTEEDPFRRIKQYYSLEGDLLAERGPTSLHQQLANVTREVIRKRNA